MLIYILFAILGGIVMNFMPCVFPIISLKLTTLSFENHQKYKLKNLFYVLGVLSFFIVTACIFIALRAAGKEILLGVQMQNAQFLISIFFVFLLIGFNLSGLFEIELNISSSDKFLKKMAGFSSYYFNGLLAAILSTPCTAPFLGTAFAYGLTSNNLTLFIITTSVGLGFAMPFILAIFLPEKTLKILPKPGLWMEKFKSCLAFLMYISCIWILSILLHQNKIQEIQFCLIGGLFLYFFFWFNVNFHISKLKKLCVHSVILLSIYMIFPHESVKESFSYEKLENAITKKQKVFIAASASWCISCYANEKNILETKKFEQFLRKSNVLYLYADLTNENPEGQKLLNEFHRAGIPLYIFINEHGKKEILPQILSFSMFDQFK